MTSNVSWSGAGPSILTKTAEISLISLISREGTKEEKTNCEKQPSGRQCLVDVRSHYVSFKQTVASSVIMTVICSRYQNLCQQNEHIPGVALASVVS